MFFLGMAENGKEVYEENTVQFSEYLRRGDRRLAIAMLTLSKTGRRYSSDMAIHISWGY